MPSQHSASNDQACRNYWQFSILGYEPMSFIDFLRTYAMKFESQSSEEELPKHLTFGEMLFVLVVTTVVVFGFKVLVTDVPEQNLAQDIASGSDVYDLSTAKSATAGLEILNYPVDLAVHVDSVKGHKNRVICAKTLSGKLEIFAIRGKRETPKLVSMKMTTGLRKHAPAFCAKAFEQAGYQS
jgi:hypothetical protein